MRTAPDHPTHEVAGEFEAYLKKLPVKPELKAKALESLNKYLKEFKTLVSKQGALQMSAAQLSAVFIQIEKIHFQLLNDTRATSQISYDHLMNVTLVLEIISILLSLLILLLSIFSLVKFRHI